MKLLTYHGVLSLALICPNVLTATRWDPPSAHLYLSRPPEDVHPQSPMVLLEGGEFLMGTDRPHFPLDGEGPRHKQTVHSFYIAPHETTNLEFLQFVRDTGYVTEAEIFGNSFVMYNLVSPELNDQIDQAVAGTPWWLPVGSASWFQPEGPDSNISRRWSHPVVHVSWHDAYAYCEWGHARLPSEAEWEMAARGGLEDRLFPWGNRETPFGQHYANVWQGEFPGHNSAEDGYVSTAPVGQFPPNRFGLFDMAGNVWEWVADSWRVPSEATSGEESPSHEVDKVMKGGSFACHRDYCYRYRCAARSKNTADSSAVHIGFRCARDHL